MSTSELEQRLVRLSARVEWPEAPSLADAVVARVAAPTPRPIWTRPRLAAAVLVVLGVMASTTLVLSSAMREAVADWLGVDGVRVTFDDETPPLGATLDLGSETSEEDAAASVSFDLRLPSALGDPDEVYFDDRIEGGAVTFLYEESEELPAPPAVDAGLLLTEFQGGIDEMFFKKVVRAGTDVHLVPVDGVQGLWLGGAEHYLLRTADGVPFEERYRIAGNTLLWTKYGVTYRLESSLGKRASVALANTLR